MRFTEWIISMALAISAFSVQAHAQSNTDSIPASEMREIVSHFPQLREEAGNGDYCFNGSQTSNLVAGIVFMRKTAFAGNAPTSPDELYSGRFANDWFGYFTERINDFRIEDSCPKGVGAFVYFFGNTMYVCPMLLTTNFTALDRASVFMHEARHIDGFPHMTCRSGPRAGIQGACDTRISDGGSYAVSVETYAQIAKYANDLHPALRAYARSAAVTYADEAFDSPVRVERELQFLVMDNDRQFHTLNLNKGLQIKALGQTPALGHIVMRAQQMILYPEDRALPARYVFARNEGPIQQQAGDIAMEYNSQTPEQRAQLVDAHLGGRWSARVYKTQVRFQCNPRSEATQDVSLNSETAASLVFPAGYDRGAASVLLVTEAGRILEVGCSSGSGYVRASTVAFDRVFKRIHKAGDDVVGLSREGQIYRISGTQSTPIASALDGKVFELIPNQSVGFFDSADLSW
jgi:hypothetical protein